MKGFQEGRFNQPSNNKGSGRWKIISNECQNHETQMGIRLVNRAIDLKYPYRAIGLWLTSDRLS